MNDVEDFHQLVHNQRHRIIENREKQGGPDDLLDDVPLYPLLRTQTRVVVVRCVLLRVVVVFQTRYVAISMSILRYD